MTEAEPTIRAHCDRGDLEAACNLALDTYSDELFGFLMGLARDRTQAEDAFSATCERLWRSLGKFRWDSSFRVWAYRIARNEFLRTTRATRRAKREVPISEIASVREAISRVQTPLHQQTAVKDRFAALRATLDPDDHMLLGLRIDKKLGWSEIASILSESDEEPSTKDIAALRKRFERLKTKLRDVAAQSPTPNK